MHKTCIRLYLCFNKPIRKNKIRFIHKTRVRLYLCFNTPIRKNKIRFIHKTRIRSYLCFNKPIRKNKIRFTHKTRIGLHRCFNTTIRLKLRNSKRRKTLQRHAYGTWSLNVHRRDSRKDNFMLYTTKSQSFSVLSCCQAGFWICLAWRALNLEVRNVFY
jgi:hypothetical protein